MSLLGRAQARESALNNALSNARETEAELRRQLDSERRRHAIESRMLRDRLQRLEQCLLSCVAAGRETLGSSLAAMLGRTAAGQLAGRSRSAHGELTPHVASLPVASPTSASAATDARVSAPFDPVATVASLLPLSQAHAGVPEADIGGALGRLQAVLDSAGVRGPEIEPAGSAIAEEATLSVTDAGERPEAEERTGASETPWFPRALRRLVAEDASAAGRLLLQLLPAQGLVWPEDVSYRVEIAETGALAVAVRGGESVVRPLLELGGEAQTDEPVLRADLAGLARTVTPRRGWSRVGARLAGTRSRHLRPLRALAGAPLELGDLVRVGAKPDPVLLLRLLSLAVDPDWTAEEIFTVAFRWRGRAESGCYLHVFERAPIAVTSAPPLGHVDATLSCAPGDMLRLLSGEIRLGGQRAQIGGDASAVERLFEWFGQVDATATRIPGEPDRVAAVSGAAS